MKDAILDNLFLIVVIGAGVVLTAMWLIEAGVYDPTGLAFIIAGGVGVYMMLTTRKVAKQLHERFNENNAMLAKNTEILQDMRSSQNKMSATLDKMSATLNEISRKLDK